MCFCGLPGRGKTHISRRLARYLEFFHAAPVSVFNVTEYRRNMYGAMMDAEWFDPKNTDAAEKRMRCNDSAVADMVQFLHSAPNAIGVLDCTNHTHERRLGLVNAIRPTGAKVGGWGRSANRRGLLFVVGTDERAVPLRCSHGL